MTYSISCQSTTHKPGVMVEHFKTGRKGEVISVADDGKKISIRFQSGDIERRWASAFVPSPQVSTTHKPGVMVEHFKTGRKGEVISVADDGKKISIRFQSGDVERRWASAFVAIECGEVPRSSL